VFEGENENDFYIFISSDLALIYSCRALCFQ